MLIEQTVRQLYQCDDTVATVRTLAETRTNEQLAALFNCSIHTVYAFLVKYKILSVCKTKAGAKRQSANIGNFQNREKVILFFCDDCEDKKPISLQFEQMPICTRCAKNRRRRLV
jgi:hypothetical protein